MEYGYTMSLREELYEHRDKLPEDIKEEIKSKERLFVEKYRNYKVKYLDKAVEMAIRIFVENIAKHPF